MGRNNTSEVVPQIHPSTPPPTHTHTKRKWWSAPLCRRKGGKGVILFHRPVCPLKSIEKCFQGVAIFCFLFSRNVWGNCFAQKVRDRGQSYGNPSHTRFFIKKIWTTRIVIPLKRINIFPFPDSNKSISGVLKEFDQGGHLSAYQPDGVSTLLACTVQQKKSAVFPSLLDIQAYVCLKKEK